MYRVTLLKDIAHHAGCSVNTVSLALKNSRRISEKTRKRVQEIAKELHYVSNNMARALVLKRTGIIGLIIRNISSLLLTSEARYIEQGLEQQGYTMYMVASHDDPEVEKKLIDMMLSNRMDGIIVNTILTENIPRLEELRADGLPVVLISGFAFSPAIDSVFPDLTRAAYIGTKHLLDLGHKQVVYVTGSIRNCLQGDLKLRGYQQALIEGGILDEHRDLICYLELHNSNMIDEQALSQLISWAKNETAFFISEDELAIPIIKLLDKHGIRVPQDIGITSIDNIRFAESCMVPLTTAGFDLHYISNRAVNMLIDGITGKTVNGKYELIKVEPGLFIRESCGYKSQALFGGAV